MSPRLEKSIKHRSLRQVALCIDNLEARQLLATGTLTSLAVLSPGDQYFTGDSQYNTANFRPAIAVTVKLITDAAQPAGNVVTATLLTVDGRPASGSASVTLPPIFDPGPFTNIAIINLPLSIDVDPSKSTHSVTYVVNDTSGNTTGTQTSTAFIVAQPAAKSILSPHSPVYSTTYDLSQIASILGEDPNAAEHDWTMSFDRTTQTIFVALRGSGHNAVFQGGGNRIIQFDPATGTAKVYSLQGLPLLETSTTDPHGTFFDFETHVTPRMWFTQRPNGVIAGSTDNMGHGQVSYIDLTTGKLVVYNLADYIRANGFPNLIGDFHAVSVANSGDVWVSDPDDGMLIQMNFQQSPNGTPNPTLNSDSGTVVVHKLPPNILGVPSTNTLNEQQETGPHGIDTVVDGETGQQYIYVSDLGNGSIVALRPSLTLGGPDQWTNWNISSALQPGGFPGTVDPKKSPLGGVPQFATLDTGETPDYPFDDKVYFADPGPDVGQFGNSGPNNVIRVINVGAYMQNSSVTTSPVQTIVIPNMPGNNSGDLSRPNQLFIDREGRVYYIDRLNGVGRFDPTIQAPAGQLESNGALINAPVIAETDPPAKVLSLAPSGTVNPDPKFPVVLASVPLLAPTDTADQSQVLGISQYNLAPGAKTNTGRSQVYPGPFRATINAASVLYGSITQADVLTTTVFAETARQQMSVVTGIGGARMAFQVLRSGHLILTGRSIGQINDQQVDLTQAINGPLIVGDTSAVVDNQNNVYVFGRSETGGLLTYRHDAATGQWSAKLITNLPNNGYFTTTPVGYIDPTHGASVVGTNEQGHLVRIYGDNGQLTDLTAQGGGNAGLVYSNVDIVEDKVSKNFYIYGTNQKGGLIEYQMLADGGATTFRSVNLGLSRDTQIFQDVSALIDANGNREVFGTDGRSQLVQVTITLGQGDSAQNVTQLTKANAIGYSAYQQPFAARVYSDLGVGLDPRNGDIYVYGTTGRELIQFVLPRGGVWQATNLTNAFPANRVFGAPQLYFDPNGSRHILQVNEDNEVVEYYQYAGLPLTTQNITLGDGNSGSPPSYPSVIPKITIISPSDAILPTGLAPAAPIHHRVGVAHPKPHRPATKPTAHKSPAPKHPAVHIAQKPKPVVTKKVGVKHPKPSIVIRPKAAKTRH
jgi:hypothetical protein